MSYYAATLIINKKVTLSDSKILEALKLYKLNSCDIGIENARYDQCLSDIEKTYVCSTKDLVIITGLPMVVEFYKISQIPFEDFIDNNAFLLFVSDSVTMRHIICYGENKSYIRKKIVFDGKYYYSQNKGDIGELLDQEMYYFENKKSLSKYSNSEVSNEEKLNNLPYLMGENDYDISLEIARNKFSSLSYSSNKELEDFLYSLVFNKNIDVELSEEYKFTLKSKFKRGELNKEVINFFNNKLKKLGFKKELYKAPAPRDIGKNTRFIKVSEKYPIIIEYKGSIIFQEVNLSVFINSKLNLPNDLIAFLKPDRYIELECNYPFFSFQILTSYQIINKTKEKIFIKKDLDTVFESFSEDFMGLNRIIELLSFSIEGFFTDSSLWNLAMFNIEKSIQFYGTNQYIPELNYCLAHIYFVKDIQKLYKLENQLLKTFDNMHKLDSADLQAAFNILKQVLK